MKEVLSKVTVNGRKNDGAALVLVLLVKHPQFRDGRETAENIRRRLVKELDLTGVQQGWTFDVEWTAEPERSVFQITGTHLAFSLDKPEPCNCDFCQCYGQGTCQMPGGTDNPDEI